MLDKKKSKKVVLMLDNEPLMIDRRIILEANTLIDQGYRLVLATKNDGIKAVSSVEYRIEVHRFNPAPLNSLKCKILGNHLKNRLMIQHWIDSPLERLPFTSSEVKGKNIACFLSVANQITKLVATLKDFFIKSKLIVEFAIKTYFPSSDPQVFFCIDHSNLNKSKPFIVSLYKIFLYLKNPPLFAAVCRQRYPKIKLILGYAFEPICYAFLLRPKYLLPYVRILLAALVGFLSRLISINDLSIDEYGYVEQVLDLSKKIKPDVVHAHDLPNLALGIEIAKIHSIPLVYDAHELYPSQFFSSDSRRSYLANLEKQLIGNADAVISVNKQCEAVLRDTYSDIQETIILSNATEAPSEFDVNIKNNLWHKQFNLNSSVKIMVFQGGINPVRNIDSLLRAMVFMPDDIHVGFITFKKDVSYYEAFTKQLGISHRVHYVIEIPWDQVIYWLAAADVGVMPYQANNLNAKISSPNKLFEFIVAGLPVIGSSELENVKNAIEQYDLGVTCLLREDDSYIWAMKEMFDELKGGPARFRENVLAVRHLFTWSNEAPRLIDLYSHLTDPNYECLMKVKNKNDVEVKECVVS